jgi:hypothetical protein
MNPDTNGPYWVPISNRRKMLLTGLSYKPDAMIAIGDHVYWDLRSPVGSVMLGNAPEAQKLVGQFTRDMPVLGTDNERKLKLVVTPQLCDLYARTSYPCRSSSCRTITITSKTMKPPSRW